MEVSIVIRAIKKSQLAVGVAPDEAMEPIPNKYPDIALPAQHQEAYTIMQTTLEKTPRIELVDALRGFAVMAIFIVHNLEHFIFPVYPENVPTWLSILDQGILNTIFALFAGKAYAIFALLFGFTFYIQCENQRRKGRDFGYRFLWRLILLIGFATLNAAFFPAGDALLLFAVVGGVLFLVRNWSNKAILITSIFFLLQPMEWFHYIAGLVQPGYQMPDWGVSAMYAEIATSTKSGNLAEFFLQNVTLGQKASLMWAVEAGRFLQTAGLFLLGLYIGRKRFFESTESNNTFWVKILIVAAIAFGPLYQLKELVMQGTPIIQHTAGAAFDMWQKLAFTLVLVSSFYLLYQKAKFRQVVTSLHFYGRMSLTNYVSQSILGAIVYFPVGLYLAPYCGYTLSFVMGLFLLVLQVKFCTWWLASHKQGPLEHIWHLWTWMGAKKKK